MIFWRDYQIPIFNTYDYKRNKYTDVVMSFDTETTTLFNINGEWVVQDYSADPDLYSEAPKIAFVYIWQIAINDDVIYGREISEFVEFLERFSLVNPSCTIIYIHNLGYDFEFFAEYMPNDIVVFAKSAYMPMYVKCQSLCVEFRCSYMLTNMTLEDCAAQFGLSVHKLSGTMAYNIARTPLTPLTALELAYCEFDVRVINALILEVFLKRYSCIADIPLTQTGEVRRAAKERLKSVPHYMLNMEKIKPNLTMYKIFTRLLQGAYTHLNFMYFDELLNDVKSFDKASSYPFAMTTQKYPMEKFRVCKDYKKNDSRYAYLMHITFERIRSRGFFTYIARHKVDKCRGGKTDNGKLHYADYGEMWVTDLDYDRIVDYYIIESGGYIRIDKVMRAYKSYLPRELILMMLESYSAKTSLKSIPQQALLYCREKQRLNSYYGMMCTNEIREEIIYNAFSHKWENAEEMNDELIANKLTKSRPFLYYAWAIWVLAYTRDIYDILQEIGIDAVYSDTDSVKLVNAELHLDVFERYNNNCDRLIDEVCEARNLDKSLFYPVDTKGNKHPLGHFELDGEYKTFLSLGSKKYCYIDNDDHFNVVVAGLRKKYVDIDGLHDTLTDITQFKIDGKIANGRTIHWHLANLTPTEVRDYLGGAYVTSNEQGIAMANTNYTFNEANDYTRFVSETRNKYTTIYRFNTGVGYENIE